MRKIIIDDNWHFPKTRRTDFSKEEMLDIIDFYLKCWMSSILKI